MVVKAASTCFSLRFTRAGAFLPWPCRDPVLLYLKRRLLDAIRMGIGMRTLEDKTFLLLIIAISLGFAWILWPFYGAVLWGTVLAIVFAPLYRRLLRSMRQRRNLAALATVMIIVVIVILPLTLITASLVQEASGLYENFQSGELNLGNFQQIMDALPTWVANLLDRFGLTNLAEVQEKLSAGLDERQPIPCCPSPQYWSDDIRAHRQTVRHAVPAFLPATRRG